MNLCECGCGQPVTKEGNRFLVGHWMRLNNPMLCPEIAEKNAAAKRGRPRSEAVKAKISATKKENYRTGRTKKLLGSNHPLWGKSRSLEVRAKISVARKGKYAGEKNPMYGKTFSKEHRRKLALAATGRRLSDETRRKISLASRGRTYSKERNARISIALKKRFANPENCPMYGKKHSEEAKRRMSASLRESFLSGNSNHSRGEDHYNWRGGIAEDPYAIGFTEALKAEVRQRDGFTCQLCGVPEEELDRHLVVHHCDADKSNHALSNLISLCSSCHGRVHSSLESFEEVSQILNLSVA